VTPETERILREFLNIPKNAEPIKVRIFWDENGYYVRITFPDGHKTMERGGRRVEDKAEIRRDMFKRFGTMGVDLT
jgi:hypothetical protein